MKAFGALAPVNMDLPADEAAGVIVNRSHEAVPDPWIPYPMAMRPRDVLCFNSRTVHSGGGVPIGQQGPRVVAFFGMATTRKVTYEFTEAVSIPPWARTPHPTKACAVLGCPAPAEQERCMCCGVPLCDAHSGEVCPACAELPLGSSVFERPAPAGASAVAVPTCAAALLPVACTRLALLLDPNFCATVTHAIPDDLSPEVCPLRAVAHEHGVIPSTEAPGHLLLTVEPGMVAVVRGGLFGGFGYVPQEVAGPGLTVQVIRWELPPLSLAPESLSRVPEEPFPIRGMWVCCTTREGVGIHQCICTGRLMGGRVDGFGWLVQYCHFPRPVHASQGLWPCLHG